MIHLILNVSILDFADIDILFDTIVTIPSFFIDKFQCISIKRSIQGRGQKLKEG